MTALFVALGLGGAQIVIQLAPFVVLIAGAIAFVYWRAREATRMFSSVTIGQTRVEVHVGARGLLGQYVVYGLLAVLVLLVAGFFGTMVVAQLLANGDGTDVRTILTTNSWTGAVTVVAGYLLVFGSFSLLAETILDFGYWKAVASGARLIEPEHLSTVRAGAEDASVVGEGLADALTWGRSDAAARPLQ